MDHVAGVPALPAGLQHVLPGLAVLELGPPPLRLLPAPVMYTGYSIIIPDIVLPVRQPRARLLPDGLADSHKSLHAQRYRLS